VDLLPSLLSAGWASGVNAYLTVLTLGLLGRAGLGEVPDQLTETPVLIVAGAMFAVEFFTDKVPYLDTAWDTIHTAIRPAVGALIGLEFAGEEGLDGLDEAFAGTGTGALALVSHGVKASIRLGINASPEPVSNVLASLTEDGLVFGVVAFSLEQPEIAAVIAVVLLLGGLAIAVALWGSIGRAVAALRERRRQSPP
jgi:Domain of unknown function (DUF4126)